MSDTVIVERQRRPDTVIAERIRRQVITVTEPAATQGANSGQEVVGEALSGLINGVNATFQTAYDFVPESVKLFVNGVRQRVVDDYLTAGNRTITLQFSPMAGESVTADYRRL